MNNYSDAQHLESYVPVYDVVPEKWEDARSFLVEQLKRITIAVNSREIGFFLDEEVLSGKSFIPGVNIVSGGGSSQQFRTILRKVIDISPLSNGANVKQHGITNDANLTNIQFWVAATNSTSLQDVTLVSPAVVVNGANINITSPGAFDRAFFIWEYIQEL